MNTELAKVVVTALRSGKYTQCKGALVKVIPKNANGDTHAFCATGIMAQIASAAGVIRRVKKGLNYGYVDQNAPKGTAPCVSTLPPAALKFFGMKNTAVKGGVRLKGGRRSQDVSLESLNDIGAAFHNPTPWTFEQIANLIEKRASDIGA